MKKIIFSATSLITSVAFIYYIKLQNQISEASFVILISIATLLSIIVALSDRIQTVSLRDLKLELAKVEVARKDVESKEKEIKQIAKSLADITMFVAAFSHRLGDEKSHELEREWLSHKVKTLMNELNVSKEEQESTFKYLTGIQEMDLVRENDKDKSTELWNNLWNQVETEIIKLRQSNQTLE